MSDVGIGSAQYWRAMQNTFGRPGQVPAGGSMPQLESGFMRGASYGTVDPTMGTAKTFAQRTPNIGGIGSALGIGELLAAIGQYFLEQNNARRETATPTTIPGQTYIGRPQQQTQLPNVNDDYYSSLVQNQVSQTGAEPYGISRETLNNIPRKPYSRWTTPQTEAQLYQQGKWKPKTYEDDPYTTMLKERLQQSLMEG